MFMQKDKEYKSIGFSQIRLPAPDDHDDHPRLLVGNYGVHAGDSFLALLPDGWHQITLEIDGEVKGPGCWYISTPGFERICPIGLFVGKNEKE